MSLYVLVKVQVILLGYTGRMVGKLGHAESSFRHFSSPKHSRHSRQQRGVRNDGCCQTTGE